MFAASMVAAMIAASCGGDRSSPAAPSRQPAIATAAGFGTIGVQTTAQCFQFAGDPACFSGARVRAQGVTSAAAAPTAPSGLTASASGSTVTLTWLAPTGSDPATSYIIEAGSASGLANLANFSTGSNATTFSAGGVPAGSYYVRVRASNSSGVSAPSNEALLVVGSSGPGPCTAAPGAPGGLTIVTNSGGTVVLTWTAASGSPTTYIVEAGSASGASNLVNSDLGGTATSLSATGVGAGTYYVRIRAKNACGTSAPSNEVTLVVGGGGPVTLTILPAALPPLRVGVYVSITFSVVGGTGTGLVFGLGAGSQIPGLFINTPAPGMLSGTPTTAGPYFREFTVTDSAGNTGRITYSGTVNP